MAFWNSNEVLSVSTNKQIHIKSIEDLKAQGIDTTDLRLEGKSINRKTSAQEIQELKSELENTQNKAEIVERFLSLEQQVASRETVMDVKTLKQKVEKEDKSEQEEKAVEDNLLAQAEWVLEGNTGTEIKEKVTKKVEESAESLLGASRDKITSENWMASLIGWPTFDALVEIDKTPESERGPWDSIIKTILTSILWAIGVGKIYESHKDDITNLGQKPRGGSESIDWDVGTENPRDNVWEDNNTEITHKERLEVRKKRYFEIGKIFVTQMWGEEFSSTDDPYTTFEKIESLNISYSELSKSSYDSLKDRLNPIKKDHFEKARRALLSGEMEIIFGSILTKENIKHLQTKTHTKELLSSLNISDLENTNWKNLEIGKLLPLLAINLSAISIIQINSIAGNGKDFLAKIFDFTQNNSIESLQEDLKEEIDTFEKEVLPRDFSKEIFWNGRFNDNSSVNMDNLFLADILGVEKDNKHIEKLLNFRDFVVKWILENKRYTLWEDVIIRSNISFRDITQLYMVFEGNIPENIEITDRVKSSFVYGWIVKIMNEKSSQWSYYWKLINEIQNGDEKYIKNGDIQLIKVITKKIIDESFVEPIIKSAKIAAGWVGEYLKQNPEILWWIAGIALALKFTPTGRAVSVLYAMVGKRWILALATSWIFAYLYSQLDTDTQKELQQNKTNFKEVTGFDLDKLLQTHS